LSEDAAAVVALRGEGARACNGAEQGEEEETWVGTGKKGTGKVGWPAIWCGRPGRRSQHTPGASRSGGMSVPCLAKCKMLAFLYH
jgi:hypothetical protein